MRSLLPFFISIICLVSYTIATNLPRLDRQPSPGKAFYTIFPKNGTDTSKSREFIKSIVGTEDLLPWTNLREQLLSWTVEASPDEVTLMRNYADIEKVVSYPMEPPAESSISRHSPRTSRRNAANTPVQINGYGVFPKNGENKDETDALELLLKQLLGADNVEPPFKFDDEVDDVTYWLIQNSNESQRDQLAKDPRVKAVEPNKVSMQRFRTARDLPRHSLPPVPSPVAELSNAKAKREVSYATQSNAASELVVVSQPSTIPELRDVKNYVYESNTGQNTFIYHLEEGVAFKAQAEEFPNVVPDEQHLQTHLSKRSGHPWDETPESESHSTCSAGKALGKKYGVSKNAKLVVAKVGSMEEHEIIAILKMIYMDIKVKPERKKKSVVTMSLGGKPPDGSEFQETVRQSFKRLLDMDVPVIVASGNNADQPGGRRDVDVYPGVWEGPDYPLLVVGSTNNVGELSDFSQGGPHVFLHAPGEDISCMPSSGPVMTDGGTSYACPMVAGEVANLLSYDTVPFDTSDGKLVQSLREHFRGNAGSWARHPDIRVLYNGVTEQHNPKIPLQPASLPPPPPPAPTPPPPAAVPVIDKKCAGIGTRKYMSRATAATLIEKEFCPTAVKQGTLDSGSGALMRQYNQGSMDDVAIAIEWTPGLPFKPTMKECIEYLLGNLVDGCDGGNSPENAEGSKAGGSMKVGEVTYRITPLTLRQPANLAKWAGCDSVYKGLFNDNNVWGRGFASADFGADLKQNVADRCALLPDTWDFSYGLGPDGREWEAKFRTGIGQNKCMGHLVSDVSGTGVDCQGRG